MRLSFFALAGVALAQQDLVSLIQSQDDLSTLLEAINIVPGLADTLNSASNITILAPTNEAFEKLAPMSQEGLALAERLVNATSTLLAYHVILGTYLSEDITEVPTYVETTFDSSYIITNTVRTNVTGGQHMGLVRFENDTVAAISAELLTSTVVEADIQVGGITIHKIDSVLFIPLNTSQTAADFGLLAGTALNSVGLVSNGEDDGTLDIVPDLTLFIPSNEALSSVGSILTSADVETLTSVLGYHAIVGSVLFSTDFTDTTIEAYSGDELTISVVDDMIFVNNAKVIIPNILLSNGVAHVIDSVLNPDNAEVNRDELDPSASPTVAFEGASSASALPFTTEVIEAFTTLSVPAYATEYPALGEESSAMPSAPSVEPASGAANSMGTAAPVMVGAVALGAMLL